MMESGRGRREELAKRIQGFSLLEVLIASFLLATVALSTLSLIAGALLISRRSSISRQTSQLAVSRLEEISRLSYDGPYLSIPEGADEVVHRERWWPGVNQWLTEESARPEGRSFFSSEVRVWSFAVSSIDEGQRYLEERERLSGAAPKASRHLKEIRIRVWLDEAADAGGSFPSATLRLVRAF